MKGPRRSLLCLKFSFLLYAAIAQAAVTGTVTNKTTNRPAAGDIVALVDIQAGMADVAHTTTDLTGRYSLNPPGTGAYLIKVTHQGASYFIAAPQAGPGDVVVYDAAAKVDGIGLDADMFLMEAAGGMLHIHERFLIRNTSLPPKAQFSDKTFEVALPANAELDTASTTRPGGMATNTRLVPLQLKGHYTFNTPIQPNKDAKGTIFELQYHLPYDGKFMFRPSLLMPADHLVIYLPPGMHLSNAQGATFEPAQEDPKVQTYVARNVTPGQAIAFTVSGEGQMQVGPQTGDISGDSGNVAATPRAGTLAPIGSPDPLSKYRGLIISLLALLLISSAAILLWRSKVRLSAASTPHQSVADDLSSVAPNPYASDSPAPTAGSSRSIMLNSIKEELFALESERLAGTLSEGEYAAAKLGLEAVLKRALKKHTE